MNIEPHTQHNLDAFFERLAIEYTDIFESSKDYAFVKQKTTALALARRVTLDLARGACDKNGMGVQRTLKHFGISNTYKAIRNFLDAK